MEIAKKLKIEDVYFVSGKDNSIKKSIYKLGHTYGPYFANKAEFIKYHKIDIHFDDDSFEVWQINKITPGTGVLVNVNQLLQENYEKI